MQLLQPQRRPFSLLPLAVRCPACRQGNTSINDIVSLVRGLLRIENGAGCTRATISAFDAVLCVSAFDAISEGSLRVCVCVSQWLAVASPTLFSTLF